ncbi:hypothetical protein AFLA70_111g002400 [Aspergillus flavus AF70]|nr:hypothetical protein AFLA70_111g002400 [Aspergillus flavus AF70]
MQEGRLTSEKQLQSQLAMAVAAGINFAQECANCATCRINSSRRLLKSQSLILDLFLSCARVAQDEFGYMTASLAESDKGFPVFRQVQLGKV